MLVADYGGPVARRPVGAGGARAACRRPRAGGVGPAPAGRRTRAGCAASSRPTATRRWGSRPPGPRPTRWPGDLRRAWGGTPVVHDRGAAGSLVATAARTRTGAVRRAGVRRSGRHLRGRRPVRRRPRAGARGRSGAGRTCRAVQACLDVGALAARRGGVRAADATGPTVRPARAAGGRATGARARAAPSWRRAGASTCCTPATWRLLRGRPGAGRLPGRAAQLRRLACAGSRAPGGR